jgi:hypothetical protein
MKLVKEVNLQIYYIVNQQSNNSDYYSVFVFKKTYIFINIFNLTNKIYKSIDNIIKTVHEIKVTFLCTVF